MNGAAGLLEPVLPPAALDLSARTAFAAYAALPAEDERVRLF